MAACSAPSAQTAALGRAMSNDRRRIPNQRASHTPATSSPQRRVSPHCLSGPPRASLARTARMAIRASQVAAEDLASAKYRGLSPAALEQAFRAEHPGLLEALASSQTSMAPANAAQLLRRLEAELPPALTDVAPGGDCVLVALAPGLLPLLESAMCFSEQLLAAGSLRRSAAISKAALCLLSRLRFGSRDSSAPYAAVGVRCKQALKAAYDAGADIQQEDIVDLHAACARASAWLWLTPYFGHRCACAVDGFITAGWRTGELAVRFTEAYSELVGSSRYSQVAGKFVRLVRAALQHSLGVGQVRRLLDASRHLPVELAIQLELHARSEPADRYHAELTQRLRRAQRAAAAANSAVASPRFAARAAGQARRSA